MWYDCLRSEDPGEIPKGDSYWKDVHQPPISGICLMQNSLKLIEFHSSPVMSLSLLSNLKLKKPKETIAEPQQKGTERLSRIKYKPCQGPHGSFSTKN